MLKAEDTIVSLAENLLGNWNGATPALFAAVKLAGLVQVLGKETSLVEGLLLIWDDETQALFAAVMSFCFGQRALTKLRQK